MIDVSSGLTTARRSSPGRAIRRHSPGASAQRPPFPPWPSARSPKPRRPETILATEMADMIALARVMLWGSTLGLACGPCAWR